MPTPPRLYYSTAGRRESHQHGLILKNKTLVASSIPSLSNITVQFFAQFYHQLKSELSSPNLLSVFYSLLAYAYSAQTLHVTPHIFLPPAHPIDSTCITGPPLDPPLPGADQPCAVASLRLPASPQSPLPLPPHPQSTQPPPQPPQLPREPTHPPYKLAELPSDLPDLPYKPTKCSWPCGTTSPEQPHPPSEPCWPQSLCQLAQLPRQPHQLAQPPPSHPSRSPTTDSTKSSWLPLWLPGGYLTHTIDCLTSKVST